MFYTEKHLTMSVHALAITVSSDRLMNERAVRGKSLTRLVVDSMVDNPEIAKVYKRLSYSDRKTFEHLSARGICAEVGIIVPEMYTASSAKIKGMVKRLVSKEHNQFLEDEASVSGPLGNGQHFDVPDVPDMPSFVHTIQHTLNTKTGEIMTLDYSKKTKTVPVVFGQVIISWTEEQTITSIRAARKEIESLQDLVPLSTKIKAKVANIEAGILVLTKHLDML